ncbi:extracellular solute-binding protein [Paenibacillus sp. SYP-B4298]|uniref:extracellular solute-binding protein n=1 Tax=Paenibacillus sp. SYP-B4298 TaxID=2996034 RepID=UPI0022DE4394|nr:extracellular solute-binding protein [Paenibacillus sp. SYP-B4298]
MSKQRLNRKIAWCLCMALTFSLLAACSGNSTGGSTGSTNAGGGTKQEASGGSDNASKEKEQEPLALSLMFNFDGVEFPAEGNEVQRRIEEITNTKLKIQQLPGSAFEEKLPVLIASGELPDAIPIPRRHQKLPYVVNAIESDMFWEIGPYLEQFPNLSKINPLIYENIAYEGKVYGIPRVRPLARRAFQYREDWAEKLKLQEPKTIDDLYAMLKAFTHDDPDGNGKQDTYGLTSKEVGYWFASFFGAPNNWKVEDGKFIKDVETEEYLNALKFEKKLYEEKLMNRDFAVIDRPEWTGAIEQGKAGVRIDVTGSAPGLEEGVQANNPDGKINFFSILEGDHGKRVFMEGGHNGFYLIPKSSVKTEEHLLRVLKFFDDLAGEEGANLLQWGIEGVHYKLVDGKPEYIDLDKYGKEVGAYSAPLSTLPPVDIALQGDKTRLQQREIDVIAENDQHLVADPSLPLLSETFAERGAQLQTMLEDANVKFVMGGSEEEWRNTVKEWRTRGGGEIAKEYEEEYAKLGK